MKCLLDTEKAAKLLLPREKVTRGLNIGSEVT
jgi:hypothetical protein